MNNEFWLIAFIPGIDNLASTYPVYGTKLPLRLLPLLRYPNDVSSILTFSPAILAGPTTEPHYQLMPNMIPLQY